MGEGIFGGATCLWGGVWNADTSKSLPMIGVVFIPPGSRGSHTDYYRGRKPGAGCTRETLSGIGDFAFADSCQSSQPSMRVYMKAGRIRLPGGERAVRAPAVLGPTGRGGAGEGRSTQSAQIVVAIGDVPMHRRNTVRTLRSFVLAAALVASVACGADAVKNDKARVESPPAEGMPRPAILPEKTATLPGSPCGWIPASEVEAVVGPLNGPPQAKDGGCFYPLPLDSIMLAHNARQKQMREALAKSGEEDLPPLAVDTGGVLVKVSVDQEAGERPLEQAIAMVGARTGADSLLKSKGDGRGWDWHGRIIGKPNFGGRAGTLMVTVESNTLGMKDEVLALLATRVRDRVPDLPFRHPAAASEPPRGHDPCGVLTRAEAEQVLGPLAFAPYPVREGGALADPAGRSCAYYSGGHRALVLTPHFTDGAGELRTFRASSGLGAMSALGAVDRDAEGADTLEGPWDEVAFGAGGQLAARSGDRMLEIAYLTSSTDLAGATRIAGFALPRLAAMR